MATKHEIVRKWALKLLQSSAQTPQKHLQAWVWFFTYVETNTNSQALGSVMFQNPPWITTPPTTPACLSLSSESSRYPIWMFYSSPGLNTSFSGVTVGFHPGGGASVMRMLQLADKHPCQTSFAALTWVWKVFFPPVATIVYMCTFWFHCLYIKCI